MIRRDTSIRIRYRDTDQMGVVYHGVYLEFFETGRTELLRDLGMAYSLLEEGGVMLPVLEASLTMLRPARYDDLITVRTMLRPPDSARLRIDYEIRNGDRLLVTGHTVHAFTTVDGMKPIRPPKAFIDLVRSSSGHG